MNWKCGLLLLLACGFALPAGLLYAESSRSGSGEQGSGDGEVLKRVLDVGDGGENLLKADGWRAWQEGFERRGDVFVCDNGSDSQVQRGVSQTFTLNQRRPEPIVAVAQSKAEGVGGGRNSDYSLYLDLVYSDGTPLWGQVDTFSVGSGDWEKAEVTVFPEKPVKSVSFHLLLRRHAGRALFRGAELRVMRPPSGASLFDGVAVTPVGPAREGFAVRDVGAGSDFVGIERKALGLKLAYQKRRRGNGVFFDVTVSETTGKDRAITLIYTIPVVGGDCRWLEDARLSFAVEGDREYVNASSFGAGANGRLSRYPFGAVSVGGRGIGLGIDMGRPAFFRCGYNAGTKELFFAYDIGLAAEKPTARLRFCRFEFDPKWGFRSALARYYELYPGHFRRRIGEAGAEELLMETIKAVKPHHLKRVIVDTTVEEMEVRYPTDARLCERARERLAKAAKERGIDLRQNYNRVAKHQLLMSHRYAHVQLRHALGAQGLVRPGDQSEQDLHVRPGAWRSTPRTNPDW